jgi:hypothetical protein
MSELHEASPVDEFPENPLIAALVPDAGDPPDLVELEGYLGRSSRRRYVRLYEVSLRGYLDVPRDRVRLVAQQEPDDGYPFSTDLIWVEGRELSGSGREPIYPGGELALQTGDVATTWTAAQSAGNSVSTQVAAEDHSEEGGQRRTGGGTQFRGGRPRPPRR